MALIVETAESQSKLPGAVFPVGKELENTSDQALPIVGDIRNLDSVESAVAKTVEQFGGIDICVNNPSAINLGPINDVPITPTASQACIPHTKNRQKNPHILTLSPPILPQQQEVADTDGLT